MTPEQARTLIEAYEIQLTDEEETEAMREHNPELLEAIEALLELADGAEEPGL